MCVHTCECVYLRNILLTHSVDFSEDYEDLSLHSSTFEKLQRKVQVADMIGKKKLSSPEGNACLELIY